MANGDVKPGTDWKAKILEARKRYDAAVAERERLKRVYSGEMDATTAAAAAHAMKLAQEAEAEALREYQRVAHEAPERMEE